MKKPITLIVLALLAVTLTVGFAYKPQETSREYLSMNFTSSGTVVISYPDGHTETSALAKDFTAYLSSRNSQINKISSMGYRLISSTSGASGMTEHIFEKE